MTPQPDDALTAVTRRPPPLSRVNKLLATLAGFVVAVGPAVAGYYAYRQAKLEAAVDNRSARGEADVGYRTLASTVDLLSALAKMHEARIAELETDVRECKTGESLTPPAPAMLDHVPQLKPLPRTLDEAAALAK